MRVINAGRASLSAAVLCVLTACGGGGGDDGPNYPPEGQIVISSGTGISSGTYYTAESNSYAYQTIDIEGVEMETAHIDSDQFGAKIIFWPTDPRKYVILFSEGDSTKGYGYGCRSAALNPENGPLSYKMYNVDLPLCASTLEINAVTHQLRASNFTIRGLEITNNQVTFSANVSWTLSEAPN